jgi:predicted nucleic acid-binding protein
MENILIDTDVVIEYLRSRDKSSTELIKLLQEHDVFLSSISEFELFLGAKTDRHQNDLEILFSEVEVIPFDFGCGKIAANYLRTSLFRPEERFAPFPLKGF